VEPQQVVPVEAEATDWRLIFYSTVGPMPSPFSSSLPRALRVGAAFASTTAGDHIEPGEKHAPITGRIVHGPGSLSAAAARG
jgi:hypothetical protein